MRKIAVILSLFIAASALGQMTSEEHLDHMRMMMHNMSSHGPVIPQPESLPIGPLSTKTINIVALVNDRTGSFTCSPSSDAPNDFVVNQGDVVTLNITVGNGDTSPANPAHIFLMEQYVESGLSVIKGRTATITFTATTAGTFIFICNQSTCSPLFHSNMFGRMVVNAAPAGPTINSISPSSGSTSGGTAVTISGSGFQSGATVTFGGVPAQVTTVSGSSITAVTPLGPTSEQLTVDVVVTNPDNSTATLHPGFTYTVPALQVTGISPAIDFTPGGGTITITGQGFTNAVASSVTIGGVAATNVTIDSPVSMHATVPAHAAGVVDVVVTIGGSSVTKTAAFTYQVPPTRRHAAHH